MKRAHTKSRVNASICQNAKLVSDECCFSTLFSCNDVELINSHRETNGLPRLLCVWWPNRFEAFNKFVFVFIRCIRTNSGCARVFVFLSGAADSYVHGSRPGRSSNEVSNGFDLCSVYLFLSFFFASLLFFRIDKAMCVCRYRWIRAC